MNIFTARPLFEKFQGEILVLKQKCAYGEFGAHGGSKLPEGFQRQRRLVEAVIFHKFCEWPGEKSGNTTGALLGFGGRYQNSEGLLWTTGQIIFECLLHR